MHTKTVFFLNVKNLWERHVSDMYETHASDSKFTNYYQYINIFSHIKHTASYILHAYYVTLHQNRNTKNQKK